MAATIVPAAIPASSSSPSMVSSSAGLAGPMADILEQFRDKLMEQRDLGSKATINALSMIAGDVRSGPLPPLLVRAVIDRATHLTSASQRLPLLYLLDSIIKNVKAPYIELFSHHVGTLFTSTYEIAPEPVRLTLLKLFKFWEQPAPLFASHVLDQCRRAVARATAAPVAGAERKRALDMGAAGGIEKKLRSAPPPAPGDMSMFGRQHMTQTWPPQQQPNGMGMGGMMGGGGPGWGQAGGRAAQPWNAATAYGGSGSGAPAAVAPVAAVVAAPMSDTQRAAAAQLEHVFGQLEAELSNRPDLRPMLAEIRIAVAQGKPMGQAIEQLTRALAEPAGLRAPSAVPLMPLRGSSPPRVVAPHIIPHHVAPTLAPIAVAPYRAPIPSHTPLPPPSQFNQNQHHHQQQQQHNNNSNNGMSRMPSMTPLFPPSSTAQPYAREPSFEQDFLRMRDDMVVFSLYEGINTALQCKTCGMRQPDSKAMGRHLDWHFSMNKRDARNIKQTPSRAWFMPPSQWILTEDAMVDIVVPAPVADSETPAAPVVHTLVAARNIPVDETQKNCVICNEAFEQYLDEDDGVWMYRAVVRLPKAGSIPIASAEHEAAQQEADRLRHAITLPYIKPYTDRLVHTACLEGLLLQAPSNTVLPPSPSIRPQPPASPSPSPAARTLSASSSSLSSTTSSNNGNGYANQSAAIPSLASFKPKFVTSTSTNAPLPVASPPMIDSTSAPSDMIISVASPANSGRKLDIRSNDDHDTNSNNGNTPANGNGNNGSDMPALEPSSTSSQQVIPILLSSFQPKCVCPSADIRSMNCRIHLPPDSPSPASAAMASHRDVPPLTMIAPAAAVAAVAPSVVAPVAVIPVESSNSNGDGMPALE